jgi:nitrogen fixation NifU-like protein
MTGMDDLRDLYQEVILDHGRNPRNFGKLPNANRTANGDNPMCGDQLTIYMHVGDDGVVDETSFEGRGCAISMASASLMTEMLKGRKEADAMALFNRFHEIATGRESGACADHGHDHDHAEPGLDEVAERLEVMSGVREFPMRVKCATLAWHTMKAALEGDETVKTE